MIMMIITLQLQLHYNFTITITLHCNIVQMHGIILNNLIYLITFGLGHKSHSQQLWEVLGLGLKTHYEKYHRNPEVTS